MRILKIEIEEFGKLSDRLFLLGEGLNLIEGANESGKSTLLAFIRFIFYGFPRKSGADGEEREKRLAWHTGRAAGRLVLRTGAGDFCIARTVVRQGSVGHEGFSETLSVTSLLSGEEVMLDGMTPGEHFLGLPATLYDSTMCLRQSDAARVSDPAVGDALNELLFAGNGGVGADVAVEKLKLARRDLQHQKGRGGRIADLDDRIAVTQDTLLRAREDSGLLSALRADVARYHTQIHERRHELEEVTTQLEELSAAETLAMFDRAHAAGSVCEQKRLNYEALCAKNEAIGDLPAVLAEVRDALNEHESAKEACRQMQPDLEQLRAVRHDEKMLAAHAVLEERGGAGTVLELFQKTQEKRARAKKTARIFFVFALIFAGLTFLVASAIVRPTLLQILPLIQPYLYMAHMIGGAVTAAFFLLSVICSRVASRHKKRARAWIKRLGVSDPQMFRTYLEQCAAEAESAEAHRAVLADMENAYAEKAERVVRAEARVRECLFDGGLSVPEEMEAIPELLAECEARYRGAQEMLQMAKGEWERAEAAFEALTKSLEGKNESELRSRFAHVGVWNPDELRRKQAFLREALAGLEKKCADTERREIALAATAKDPVSGESELSALRAEHRSATRRLAALEMAIGAMEEATRSLGEGIIPRLCEKASTHLATLTCGAYKRIYAGADLSVSLDSEKGPLPLSHFSAGCRDAAHLALRLGLLDVLSEERLPLLLDEALSRLDDERAAELLTLLVEYCHAGGQCLLFTCHSREGNFLADKEITHFELQ